MSSHHYWNSLILPTLLLPSSRTSKLRQAACPSPKTASRHWTLQGRRLECSPVSTVLSPRSRAGWEPAPQPDDATALFPVPPHSTAHTLTVRPMAGSWGPFLCTCSADRGDLDTVCIRWKVKERKREERQKMKRRWCLNYPVMYTCRNPDSGRNVSLNEPILDRKMNYCDIH